jgi:hypothetical protein
MTLAPIQLKNILREHAGRFANGARGNRALFLTLLPSIALGLWTLWIYLSVGRLQQSLSTDQLRLAVREAKETRIQATHDLALQPLSSANRYRGTFSIDIENLSRKRLEVSWVVFETYIGKIGDRLPDNAILSVNEPPKRELNIEEPGIVKWQYQGSRGFLYPGSKHLKYANFATEKYYRVGGGLTKSLAPGDKAAYSLPIIVSATPDYWVAVVAILGIDGAEEGDNVFYYADWVELATAAIPPNPNTKVQ